MSCPVDHKKTGASSGECPVDHKSAPSSGEAPAGEGEAGGKFMPPPMEPYEISNPEPGVEPPSNPSDLEYAKIKKTVGLMVSFYKGGADKKLEQLNKAKMELEKIEYALEMNGAQMKSLEPYRGTIPPGIHKFADEQPTTAPVPRRNPYADPEDIERRKKEAASKEHVEGDGPITGTRAYLAPDGTELTHLTERTPEIVMANEHPRVKEYLSRLETEREQLKSELPDFEKRVKEYGLLHEWSLGIVRAMQWLESNMDEYCEKVLGLKITGGWKKRKEKVVLTEDEAREYRMGLQEVTWNLQESQDFFDASLDGRLTAYLTIERDAVAAQIAAVAGFDDAHPRKAGVLAELEADLASVETSLAVERKRNEKMHDLHTDFFRVLLWQREVLQGMGVEGIPGQGVTLDRPGRKDGE